MQMIRMDTIYCKQKTLPGSETGVSVILVATFIGPKLLLLITVLALNNISKQSEL